MRARSVSLIQPCFPSSAAVYHAENPNRLSGKKECMCVSVCASTDATSPIRPRPYNTLFFVFFFFLSRNPGDSLVPVAGLYRAKAGSSI